MTNETAAPATVSATVDPNPVLQEPPAWRRYLAYLTVALMPLSANVEKIVGSKSRFFLSPLDFLLPILALLLLVDLLKKRPWVRFTVPPLPVILWVGVCWASVLWMDGFPARESLLTWMRGLVNPVFFGLVAVWVFQNISADAREYRKLALILCGSFGVCILLALKQYVGPQGLPFDPDSPTKDLQGVTNVRLGGWYDFRGIFGAHAALLVPAAVAFAVAEKDAALRAGAAALAVVGLCVTLAAGGFIGACVGIVAVAAALLAGKFAWRGVLVLALLAVVVGVMLPKLPRENLKVIQRGLALYADDEKGERKPTARLRRYQSSLAVLGAPRDPQNEASAPKGLLGAGLGRYQKEVNAFYREPYPKPGRRTDDEASYDMESDEPMTFGFFETVTVETGVLGLTVVLTLFATWIAAAQGAFARLSAKSAELDARATLALASLGAGAGAMALSVFANPVIRGVGGTFAFFIAVAYCCSKWAEEEAGR